MSASIPVPPSGPAPPPLSSDKYDGDFDTSSLPVEADDVLPAAVDEAVPLTKTDIDDGTTERHSAERLLISRSLFRDDTTGLRLRAKKGEVAVFPNPQIVHEASDGHACRNVPRAVRTSRSCTFSIQMLHPQTSPEESTGGE